jgi:hypothetical protein
MLQPVSTHPMLGRAEQGLGQQSPCQQLQAAATTTTTT